MSDGPRLVGTKLVVPVVLETAVLSQHHGLVTGVSQAPGGGTVVEMDVRRAPWREVLDLPRATEIHWADVRTVDISELSVGQKSITYRLTYGDGWYVEKKSGGRRYFPIQPELKGIDLDRQCTTVAVRAAVLLAVMGGIGLRTVCWLMGLLFQFEVSKSSLDRWVKACAAQLPDAAGMAKVLHADKPITEANFDEIFGTGQRPKRCTLVLRDEHGRIFATRQVEERTEEVVTAFLKDVKSWGLQFRVFYVDGCEAYRAAIRNVFPEAIIQYDYFHVIQNIWRKLWKTVVARRKDIKERGEAVETPAYGAKLLGLAQRIWDGRFLFFKRDENLSEKEKAEMLALMEADSHLEKVRGFVQAIWDVFENNPSGLHAEQALERLGRRPEVTSGSPFEKSVEFLWSRFEDIAAFLKHPNIRRNSLAETGIRCLRRLERGHDGFRGAAGLDCYVRIYQAVKYCGWAVHRPIPGLELGFHPPALPLLPSAPRQSLVSPIIS